MYFIYSNHDIDCNGAHQIDISVFNESAIFSTRSGQLCHIRANEQFLTDWSQPKSKYSSIIAITNFAAVQNFFQVLSVNKTPSGSIRNVAITIIENIEEVTQQIKQESMRKDLSIVSIKDKAANAFTFKYSKRMGLNQRSG